MCGQTTPQYMPITIPTGATALSAEINLMGWELAGIIMPATWVAAALTFSVAFDTGKTFMNAYDTAGTELSYTVAASRFVRFASYDWTGVQYLKIRSGPAAAPVDQTANRILVLLLRPV